MIRWAGARWGGRSHFACCSEGVEGDTTAHARSHCTGRSARQTKARCARRRLGNRCGIKIWEGSRARPGAWRHLSNLAQLASTGEGEFGARIPRERRSHAIASTDLTSARDLIRGVEQPVHSACPSPHRAALAPDGRLSSRRRRPAIPHGGSPQPRIRPSILASSRLAAWTASSSCIGVAEAIPCRHDCL